MSRQPLLLASTNAGKLAELRRLALGLPVAALSPADLPFPLPPVNEDGATFLENAIAKALTTARAAASAGASALWVLADDSGLVVDALGGAPGVRSARYAETVSGPSPELSPEEKDSRNVKLLLARLQDVPAAQRTARFVCALSLAQGERLLFTTEATVEGRITTSPRGEDGFGYDPVFFHEPSGATLASLDPEAKDRVSHRGLAMANLRRFLERTFDRSAAG